MSMNPVEMAGEFFTLVSRITSLLNQSQTSLLRKDENGVSKTTYQWYGEKSRLQFILTVNSVPAEIEVTYTLELMNINFGTIEFLIEDTNTILLEDLERAANAYFKKNRRERRGLATENH